MAWIQTDETQWVHKINEDAYDVIEYHEVFEGRYYLSETVVSRDLYPDEVLADVLSGYSDVPLKKFQKHNPHTWFQLLAEMVSESEFHDNATEFENKEEILIYLKEEHGI